MKHPNPNQAEPIPVPQAVAAIKNWLIVAKKAFPEVGDPSLLRAFRISMDDINDLYAMGQDQNAKWVRAYLAIDDRSDPALTAGLYMVPVDAQGNDIVTHDDQSNIRNFTKPCPHMCDTNYSVLMPPVPPTEDHKKHNEEHKKHHK